MRTTAVVFYLICLAVTPAVAQAQLKIDFTPSGGVVQAEYQGYFATHENSSTFTSQSYTAFDTTVTITPSWVGGASASAMQMIDRTGDDGTDTPNLLRDWIGTDSRPTGDPMKLTISGLPLGTYSWLSYHHDPEDQTGVFSVTVNDASGSNTTTGIDISSSQSDGITALANVTVFESDILSNGSDVTLEFSVTSGINPVYIAFFAMNAFVLESQNPCYNSPPAIDGQQTMSTFVDEPISVDVTVTDDGKPYVEGGKVTATVASQGRGKKVMIIKFRRRKHSRKTQGHRQAYTELEITGISG